MDLEPSLTPYKQIINYYIEEINEGRLATGERLPTVAKLSQEWGLHRTTVYKAIQGLQQMGYVTSDPGGSTVAEPVRMWEALEVLLNLMEDRGLDPQIVDTNRKHGVYGNFGAVIWDPDGEGWVTAAPV